MNTIRVHALCSLRRGIIANRAFLEASKATERITYFMTSQNSHNNDKTRFVPSHCASAYSTLNDNNNHNNNNNNNKNKPFKSLFACYSPSSTNASVVASNKGVSLLNSKSTAPLYPKRKLVIGGQAHFASTVPASTEARAAACQDLIEAYISVHEALNNLEDRGTEIGEVVTEDHPDYDDYCYFGEEENEEEKKTSATKTPDDLAEQLESITKYSFAIGGHYEIGDELRLYIGNLCFVCAKGNARKEAEAILRLCDPAPFGDLRTQTTVLDPSVRVAYEAARDKFKLLEEPQSGTTTTTATNEKRPGFLDDIACYIQDHLMGTPFNLVPYKLNVYSEGGFFLPHVDTPTSPMMLGTLVVALPYEHSGGELIVTHRGMTKTFDFAPKSADRTVQWAAFFGDCVHEVRPVTSGKRITVTYSIVRASSAPLRPSPSNDSPCRDFITAGTITPDLQNKRLEEAVSTVEELIKEDGKLGVLMTHRYTLTGVEGNEGLKGLDRAFYDALEATGKYSLHVVPVAFKRYKEKYIEEGLGTLDRKVYLLSQDHIEYLRGRSTNKKPENPVGTGIRFVEVGNYKGSLLSRVHQSGAEYAGNEALPETDLALYFNAALIILTKDQQQQQQQ